MATWKTIEAYITYLYSKNTKGVILSFDNPHNAYHELLSSGVDPSTVMNLDAYINKYDNSYDEYETQYILHINFGETSTLINDLLRLNNNEIKSVDIYDKYPGYNMDKIITHFIINQNLNNNENQKEKI